MNTFDSMTPEAWDELWKPGERAVIPAAPSPRPTVTGMRTGNFNRCDVFGVCRRRRISSIYCEVCPRLVKIQIERMAGMKIFTTWDEHTREPYEKEPEL